ncbi:hypothetical protein BUE76_22150 [Cnuella takakiae]|nr:hypothetical protein BUE76_22150 [Cnuella takakiae]
MEFAFANNFFKEIKQGVLPLNFDTKQFCLPGLSACNSKGYFSRSLFLLRGCWLKQFPWL